MTLVEHTMKRIPLTQGKSALVDDEDFKALSAYNWCASKSGERYYAVRGAGGRKARRTIYMHRLIMSAPDGKLVDHKNRDGLDNRRSNLRITDKKGNEGNSSSRKGASSKFKGVYLHKKTGAWVAGIKRGGKGVNLGSWLTETHAALAYDRAARAYFGEFARLNCPDHKDYSDLDGKKIDRRKIARKKAARKLIIDGESKTISEWCLHFDTNLITARSRIRRGWDPVRAVTV